MKHLKIITALLILGFYGFGQNVTPDPGPYSPLNQKYIYRWVKTSGGIWNLGKFVQEDSAQFKGVTYVPTALDADSNTRAANTAWVRKWVADNVSPGLPGVPVYSWSTAGNYSPSDPTPYRLGLKDSMPLKFITNNQIRLIIPDNGVKRNYGLANKFLVIDTATKELYYMDVGGSSVTVTSYGKNATLDSTILLLSDGTRFAAKDSVGSGGGGGSDTLKVSVSDTALMLLPYLRSAIAAATYLDKTTSQSAYTVYGRGSGSGTPSFLSLDSSWLANMHTQGYYDGRYSGIGTNITSVGSPNANPFSTNGASVTSGVLSLTYANSSSIPGIVSTGSQSFFGGKTFQSALTVSASFTVSGGIIANTGMKLGPNPGVGTTGQFLMAGTDPWISFHATNVAPPLNLGFNIGTKSHDFVILSSPSSINSFDGTENLRIKKSTGNILIGTSTDLASSLLTVASTSKGVLIPRMTTTERTAITSPAEGLMVYDLTLHKLYVYDGTTWQAAW